jgi:hypothetical protein
MNIDNKVDTAPVVLDLFKRILFNSSEGDVKFYESISQDFVDLFEHMEDRSFSMSLSGKWSDQLVFFDLKLVPGIPKMVMLNINGKEVMTTLTKHPLVEHFI